jgi:beta-glucosidase
VVASVTQPVKELKGFQKIVLLKGESKTVSFTINIGDLKFYDQNMKLIAEPGVFRVYIGTSSSDLKMAQFTLTK